MPALISTEVPADLFTLESSREDSIETASRKVRIIIKEKGGNWQDTVLRAKGGLPDGTELVMNCFPGKKIPHTLVRELNAMVGEEGLDPELQKLVDNLHENHITSPVTVPLQRFDAWYLFVNEKVWRKFHQLESSAAPGLNISADEWHLYQTVNKKYAKALARDIIADMLAGRDISLDINWLHDFQLMLVFHYLEHYLSAVIAESVHKKGAAEPTPRYSAEEQHRLRAALPSVMRRLKTSYFHHIPWPDVETFRAEFPVIANQPTAEEVDADDSDVEAGGIPSEPDSIDTGREILAGLLSANHVAFQTDKDLGHFLACVASYYEEARIVEVNPHHRKIFLADKEIDAHVNAIGTDYRLFATADLSDQAIVQYFAKLLGAEFECIEPSTERTFSSRLAELTNAAKKSYLTALIQAFLTTLAADPNLVASIEGLLTPENLREEHRHRITSELVALLNDKSATTAAMADELFTHARHAVTSLQKAQRELLKDFDTLQPLRAFKSRNPALQLFTSIGRLDPEKNVPVVLDAYLTYLQDCFANQQAIKNSLLLFIVPSRLEVPAYKQELITILAKYDAIKQCLTEHGLNADDYIYLAEDETLRATAADPAGTPPSKPKLVTPNGMVEFYRLGTTVVSSRADGMNLVVKEWVAAQDNDVKSCLHGLFEFVQHCPEPAGMQAMNSEQNAVYNSYARALRQEFSGHEQLAGVLEKLSRHFPSLVAQFFAEFKGTIPPLPMLSKNAGAARQLTQACIIDPLNSATVTAQFHEMDNLDVSHRFARALEITRTVAHEDGQAWRRDIIDQVLAQQTLHDAIQQIGLRFAKDDGLILVDYDGTIAPLVANPNEAWPDTTARRAIINLLKIAPERLVFITGRDVDTFEQCFWGGPDSESLQKIPVTVIGSHGVEIKRRDGSLDCLLNFNATEQAFIDRMHSDEAIVSLKTAICSILQAHFDDVAGIDIDALIEIKKYSVSILSKPLQAQVKSASELAVIEQQFADLLKHFLLDQHGIKCAELAQFSVWQGKNISELRYNATKAQAAEQLLRGESYSNVKHITFLGDDFGQATQPGTDYSLAAWLNDPASPYQHCVMQVMPYAAHDTQKQAVASPARPDIVLDSPQVAGQVLTSCCEYALEATSRSALITSSFAQLRPLISGDRLLPSQTKQVQLEEGVIQAAQANPAACSGLVTV